MTLHLIALLTFFSCISNAVDLELNPIGKTYKHINEKSSSTHRWSQINNEIGIEGFNEYGLLTLKDSSVIGKEVSTGQEIEFKEVSGK